MVLTSVAIDAIAVETGGAHPSYADGYYDRDNAFYEAWGPVSRDRERFREWMEKHVLGTENFFGEYLKSVKEEGRIGIGAHPVGNSMNRDNGAATSKQKED